MATEGVDMFQRAFLRLSNVVNDGAACSGCKALVCESESFQSGGLQLVAQDTRRIVRVKQPILHRRFGYAIELLNCGFYALGKENFARRQMVDLKEKATPALRPTEL